LRVILGAWISTRSALSGFTWASTNDVDKNKNNFLTFNGIKTFLCYLLIQHISNNNNRYNNNFQQPNRKKITIFPARDFWQAEIRETGKISKN